MQEISFKKMLEYYKGTQKEELKACKTKDEIISLLQKYPLIPFRKTLDSYNLEYPNGAKDVMLPWVKENIEFNFDIATTAAVNGKPVEVNFNEEKIEKFLGHLFACGKGVPADDVCRDISKLVLTENLPIEYQDNFAIDADPIFAEEIVILKRKNSSKLMAYGEMKYDNEQKAYRIILPVENIKYNEFENNSGFDVLLFTSADIVTLLSKEYIDASDVIEYKAPIYIQECYVEYKSLTSTNNVLCIDFGTCNTAVGTYGLTSENSNEIQLVQFVDETSTNMEMKPLFPTVVYVEDCSDIDNIKYIFGYAAQKKVEGKLFETRASIFYEIKRWMETLDVSEKLTDENNNVVEVPRKEVVKAYIKHVITLSERFFKHRFNKLHFSAPVKFKELFNQNFNELLKDENDSERYLVLPPSSTIDEGIAIVYNSINRLIECGEIENDETRRIMILDCGGGTTDLASCSICPKQLDTGKLLRIDTQFVNGNANFGGNNITYRILQLLKIKYAAIFARKGLCKTSPDELGSSNILDLFNKDETSILNAIEEQQAHGYYQNTYDNGEGVSSLTEDVYKLFNESYMKAESVLPTRYARIQKIKERDRIKRNYHYLWQLAEDTKVKFYAEDLVQFEGKDKSLDIDASGYYVYVYGKGGQLEKMDLGIVEDELQITVSELHRLLCGDIFGLLNELILDESEDYANYDYYRLSGQSCKISLFMELLKEFIPGRKLRTNKTVAAARQENNGSLNLKLDCLRGSIAYTRDKEFGIVKPEFNTVAPKLIYDIFISKGGRDELLVLGRDNVEDIGMQIYSQKATKAEFVVRDSNGHIVNKFIFDFERQKESTIEAIRDHMLKNKSKSISDDAIGQLLNEIIAINPAESDESQSLTLVFAIPSEYGYGINIYQIMKSVENNEYSYYWNERVVYKNYESSVGTFFDGNK